VSNKSGVILWKKRLKGGDVEKSAFSSIHIIKGYIALLVDAAQASAYNAAIIRMY
jgi:hypothetical protein